MDGERPLQVLWRVICTNCKTANPVDGLYIFITELEQLHLAAGPRRGREDSTPCKRAGAALTG